MWQAAGNVGRGRGIGGGDVGVGGEGPTPGWPGQWPVNQNMYQNIPHEQIDWAALAQQWIQMRETGPPGSGGGGGGGGSGVMDMSPGPHFPGLQHGLPDRLPVPHHLRMANAPLLPPGPHSHAGPPQPPPPPQQQMTVVPGAGHQHQIVRPPRDVVVMNTENSNARDLYGTSGDWGSYWSSGPGWGPNAHPQSHQHMQQQHAPNWAPPTAERKDGAGSFDYGGHLHGNHGYAAQTYEYNHGTDHIGLSQGQVQGDEHTQFNQFWSSDGGIPGAPPFLRRDITEFVDQVRPVPDDDVSTMPALDAAKRKNLPAWIRDGLEKMERDKQKKVEREEMLVQRELRLQAQRVEEEKAVREFHSRAGQRNEDDPIERNVEAVMPSKSKFESDSEGGGSDDESGESDSGSTKRPLKSSPSLKSRTPTPPPFEAVMTEQERTEEMMNKVRRLLTEILLEVTNEEIGWIAKEVFSKARAKAPARQLAKSSALASITGSLGLGGYSSDSEDSEGGEKDGGGDDVDGDGMDSDAELQEKIHRRRLEFARRERELYGDDASVDSSHSVKQDQQSQEESTDDSEGRKESLEESISKNEMKSKDRSEFERNWYSEDKISAPDATVPDTSSTIGSVESAMANANQTDEQLELKRESAKDDHNHDEGHFVRTRRSDAKRSKKSDSSSSRSQSRDRSGDKRGSVSHRSRRHRSGSWSPEKRPRQDSSRSSRDEAERTKSGYGNRHRRNRSRSTERAKSRRSRSRSRDGHRVQSSIKRRKRLSSSTSSSSSSASSISRKRLEKKKGRERDKGRSTTMKKMLRRSESESSSSKSSSSKSSSRRRRRSAVSSSSKPSTGTKRRDSRSEIKSGRSRNK